METTGRKHMGYMAVWAWLFALTIAEVGVAFISQLSKTTLIVMLIAIAVWKALLVALYYMHLRSEPQRLVYVVLAPLPLAAIFVVAVLLEGW